MAAFESQITGLEPEEHYYVRAYATNEAGTAYGAAEEFDALALVAQTLEPEYDIEEEAAAAPAAFLLHYHVGRARMGRVKR